MKYLTCTLKSSLSTAEFVALLEGEKSLSQLENTPVEMTLTKPITAMMISFLVAIFLNPFLGLLRSALLGCVGKTITPHLRQTKKKTLKIKVFFPDFGARGRLKKEPVSLVY